ncbi:hypothetical protein QRD43_12640 [Pelomonas sp. APW6]|uniref:UDP-N-acetylmuramate--alanine ligase n=1 Tax=Roseateles subflavus TaxID=3053353 RepID=A0ABT7LIQ4_9BURK|nr:hypothetical protein [Pelomonas sp. APW6]MDL5032753.1 hypothetical protein [Pelomonas sp. APW6]
MASDHPLTAEIAATAARLVVEEGLEYGAAKRRAHKQLGLPRNAPLPSNEELEDEVRDYLALFCADTQPGELRALREQAAVWMERLAEFRPHLCGAVWRGTATRLSNIHLQLYCDDSKSAEIALINAGVDYEVGETQGPRGPVDLLTVADRCRPLNEWVTIALSILDKDDLRGALKPDSRGRTERGDLAALRRLLDETPPDTREGAAP